MHERILSPLPLAILSVLWLGDSPLTTGRALASSFDLSECKEVTTTIEDPFPPFGDEAATKVAGIVCKKVQELAPLFGVRLDGQRLVGLFITQDMESFRRRTGRGPYTLAVFSSRLGIITQPAQTLDMLQDTKRLERTITHELTHFFIDRVAGPTCPTWLHEGLAQWFEGLRTKGKVFLNEDGIRKLEMRWHSRAVSVQQRSRDYHTSLVLVSKIIRRVGQPAILEALRRIRDHDDALDLEINGRSLREWLYSADAPEPEPEKEGDFEIVRGEEWTQKIAEELSPGEEGAKVIHFDDPQEASEDKVTPLPLKQMLKKAGKKKKRKQKK